MSYLEDRLKEIQADGYNRIIFKNVVTEKSRHGRVSYYYRPGKGKRIRLPDRAKVGREAFEKAYMQAVNGVPSAPRTKRSTVPDSFMPIGAPGYVYFAKAGDQVKIGFTKNLRARASSIQTSCAAPVQVLAVIPGSIGTEKFFHERFEDYRVGGEWFSLVGLLEEFLNVKR